MKHNIFLSKFSVFDKELPCSCYGLIINLIKIFVKTFAGKLMEKMG
ncbi:MAG: hypothetical protein GY795_14660 [Desulfobacterales bacterium]|nr:hypothetical protein [Desulfobacterales bacterium]